LIPHCSQNKKEVRQEKVYVKLFTIEYQGDRCLVQYNEEETEAEGLEEAALVGEEEAEERPLVALMEQLHQVHEEQ